MCIFLHILLSAIFLLASFYLLWYNSRNVFIIESSGVRYMIAEEIIRNESYNVEFKQSLPDKSEKYLKTIAAFANSAGGKLVIGVEDETRKIVGVDTAEVFELKD